MEPENEKPKELDFLEILAQKISTTDEKYSLVHNILEQARAGEASALKMVMTALERVGSNEEDRIKINNEQLKTIIVLAAERFNRSKVS